MSDLFAALVRGAHYASVVSSFGCFAFLLAVALPTWRAAAAGAEKARQLERFLLRLAAWSVLLAVASGLLWLWVVAAGMSGSPLGAALSASLIGTVLTETGFGHLWQFRFAVEIVLAGFLLYCRLTGRHSGWLFSFSARWDQAGMAWTIPAPRERCTSAPTSCTCWPPAGGSAR